MELKILSFKKESESKVCYLCESTIRDYLEALPEDYKNFNIQRGIVSNIYLDNLTNTILLGKHIPPITLVTDSDINFQFEKNEDYSIQSFRVLDGLQRTYRLKVLWDSIKLMEDLLTEKKFDILNMDSYQITRQLNDELDKIGTDGKAFYDLVIYLKESGGGNITYLKEKFNINQWFEIWVGLSPDDEIDKMLVLNAGHKQMTTQHQLELLFLNLLKLLEKIKFFAQYEFVLIREKEMNSTTYGKKREKGMYYFPHLISLTLSFLEARPVTSNVNLVRKIQYNENSYLDYKEIISYEFMQSLLKFLIEMDTYLYKVYGDSGIKWISKDTVLTGIFAAIGNHNNSELKETDLLFERIMHMLNESEQDLLNIEEFNKYRNSMNIGNVNIGNFTKKAVFQGVMELLNNNFSAPINWKIQFEGGRK
ncbi:hypothetical protein [Bacillus sp. ISL-37]|uniref:hypothetical protein n=1 Tax=Bacillus sp. ISL-37 TaxID=2819123 RepID=UPI001BED3339|nr:hypothetical protein [Bacillus sp. ISL-37]MBT2684660.1 hypothetical protein [Bacillus sp. ISL-37]